MTAEKAIYIAIAAIISTISYSCGSGYRAEMLNKKKIAAGISLPDKSSWLPELDTAITGIYDTLIVANPETGNNVLIMKAVKDDNGEMVATDIIRAATVTARFRNVAERNGRIDLAFNVTVPAQMQNSRWQLRFDPTMYILSDSVRLDKVIITGKDYRMAQIRGYQQYEKWLSKIVSDSTKFVNIRLLEIFLQRNIPQLYELKKDTTFVSEYELSSIYGVTEKEAIEHYTNKFLRDRNERRKARRSKMYNKFVKSPILYEGLRLDTVLTDTNGDFVYKYIQTINTRPGLRKVDIALSGAIYEQEKKIYSVPRTDKLTFYISSLSALAEPSERFITKIVERRAEANTACYIDFPASSSEIVIGLSNNKSEMARIRSNIAGLLGNSDFELDSISVTASCSPEGGYVYNRELSKKRGEAVCEHFNKEIKYMQDSIVQAKGISYNLDRDYDEKEKSRAEIRLIPRINPENWIMLDALVKQDTSISEADRFEYFNLSSRTNDDREAGMRTLPSYPYFRSKLYPRLRTVRFVFYLHRKGMIKDTVHTTVIDSVYMSGVQAIKDRDYEKALALLRPYKDYNAAVALCIKGYDASALSILEGLEKTDKVNYMLAVLYARNGEYKAAVQHYITACSQNRSYISRGNLDPEISFLISKYSLNQINNQ